MNPLYNVIFEQNNLALIPGVELYNHDMNIPPTRDIKINKLAKRSRSIVTSSDYVSKTIPLYFEVCSGTRPETEATITLMKSLLQTQNGTLEAPQSGYQVRYRNATMNEFNIEWDGPKAYVQVSFIVANPFGIAVEAVTFASLLITTPSTSYTNQIEGSALAEPLINVVLNDVTGGTGQSISLYNGKTNQGIKITADFVTGDILIIDSENMRATINGQKQDFDGIFPTFPAGTNQIGYTDTFTTRNANLTMQYNPKFN